MRPEGDAAERRSLIHGTRSQPQEENQEADEPTVWILQVRPQPVASPSRSCTWDAGQSSVSCAAFRGASASLSSASCIARSMNAQYAANASPAKPAAVTKDQKSVFSRATLMETATGATPFPTYWPSGEAMAKDVLASRKHRPKAAPAASPSCTTLRTTLRPLPPCKSS